MKPSCNRHGRHAQWLCSSAGRGAGRGRGGGAIGAHRAAGIGRKLFRPRDLSAPWRPPRLHLLSVRSLHWERGVARRRGREGARGEGGPEGDDKGRRRGRGGDKREDGQGRVVAMSATAAMWQWRRRWIDKKHACTSTGSSHLLPPFPLPPFPLIPPRRVVATPTAGHPGGHGRWRAGPAAGVPRRHHQGAAASSQHRCVPPRSGGVVCGGPVPTQPTQPPTQPRTQEQARRRRMRARGTA